MKKSFLFVLSLILFVFIIANIYTATVFLYANNNKTSQVRFTVTDITDNAPVYNACVCIPEASFYYYTDNNGNTPLISVPVITNKSYDNICKKDFGEITVIVYKEGYCDYILFNFVVKENESRQDIKLLLYKKENCGQDFISIVETPDEQWTQQIIDKYRK